MNLNQKFGLPIAKKPAVHKLLALAVVVGAFALSATHASAIPITGEIHFVGSISPTGGTDLGTATGLHFNSSIWVIDATGNFSSAQDAAAAFKDFQFSPALSPSPVNQLWSINSGSHFTFELDSIRVDFQDSNNLNLSGDGIIRGDGFDATAGTWSFQSGTGFIFRADSSAVPDAGTTVFLLGTVLIGLSLCRKPKDHSMKSL